MIYPGASVTKGQCLMAIMFFVLHHHLTKTSLIYLLALLNLLVPNLVPTSKYLFKTFLGNPALTAVSHLFCDECQNYLGKQPEDTNCSHCGTSIRETKLFFLSILFEGPSARYTGEPWNRYFEENNEGRRI